MIAGFLLGVVFALASQPVGLGAIWITGWTQHWFLVGIAAAGLVKTRAWFVPWAAAALTLLVLAVASFTPLAGIARSLVRVDAVAPVEAVAVLSADISSDGVPSPQMQSRLDHAYRLLQTGNARVLVLTRLPAPKPSYVDAVRNQLRAAGLTAEIVETRAVRNTRDEAALVSALGRARGWNRMLLVSDPTHMRRARALFERAGQQVLCSPGPNPRLDLDHLSTVRQRLAAFRVWVYESFHYQVAKVLGRI